MKTRRHIPTAVVAALAAVIFLPPGSAWAEEGNEDPGTGTVHVALKGATFAIPHQDGERWENFTFSPDGKTLMIEEVGRSQDYTFEIRPAAGAEPTTVVVQPKCWKLVKLDKVRREWRCTMTATFKKVKQTTPAPEVAPPPDEPDDDVPPMPGVTIPPPRTYED